MRKTVMNIFLLIFGILFISCNTQPTQKKKEKKEMSEKVTQTMSTNDKRVSLALNPMQKQHQLKNMRSHLEAIQNIIGLIAKEKYDEASKVAYTKLGSTTEMKLMCSSFGNKNFENMGLDFHKSADKMSEIFKNKDKDTSLEALSITMNYCIQCHATFKQ